MAAGRTKIINTVIKKYQYKRYLEIGVRNGSNFNKIEVDLKHGVDPRAECAYKMTSDIFFLCLEPEVKYDIIFIDGLHIAKQVLKDVDNSLKHLADNGTIVLHDCNPQKKSHAKKHQIESIWNGTVWQAISKLRITRTDLFIQVVDIDHGCGIIRRGRQLPFPLGDRTLTFKLFSENRKELLNLISYEEFCKLYGT